MCIKYSIQHKYIIYNTVSNATYDYQKQKKNMHKAFHLRPKTRISGDVIVEFMTFYDTTK